MIRCTVLFSASLCLCVPVVSLFVIFVLIVPSW
jgi:hypothetical protein